jgi:thiol-disulfide isomerase/thioredoxin
MIWAASLLILAMTTAHGDEPGPSTIRGEFDRIAAEQAKARAEFEATWPRIEGLKAKGAAPAELDRIRHEATARYLKAVESNSGRVLAVVEAHPDDPAVVDALTFVIRTAGAGPSDHSWRALKILARDHPRDPGMGSLGGRTFHFFFMPEVEALLRGVLDRNPSREERARACYNLAYHLRYQAHIARRLRAEPTFLAYPEPWRKALADRFIREADPEAIDRRAESLMERCLAEFADVPLAPGDTRPIGLVVDGELFALRNLAVGKVAPEILGTDVEGVRFRLGDHRGKVVVLTFSGNWCGPCVGMYPQERALLERYRSAPFAMVSVNTDKDRETLRKAIREGEITWPCWWDGGTDGPITTAWGVSSFPSIFVLDRDGVIRFKDVRGEALDRAVAALLDPKAFGSPAAGP